MKHTFWFIIVIAALSVLQGCKGTPATANAQAVPVPVSKASVVPAAVKAAAPAASTASTADAFPFDIELKDADGKSYNSKDVFKDNGKPTVLLFWLTTCKPCHMKLSAIKPLYPQWKEEADFNVFAISGDYSKNYNSFVNQTKAKDWEWDTYIDVNRSFRNLLPGNLNGYPQTFIFDKNGKLAYQDKRYRPGDADKLFAKIKEICNS